MINQKICEFIATSTDLPINYAVYYTQLKTHTREWGNKNKFLVHFIDIICWN
jgi:hypothetical protein